MGIAGRQAAAAAATAVVVTAAAADEYFLTQGGTFRKRSNWLQYYRPAVSLSGVYKTSQKC